MQRLLTLQYHRLCKLSEYVCHSNSQSDPRSPQPPQLTASQENKLPGPSRTPSGSPLPTPTSSQTRIHDIRGRTRKISQTAHDGVDLLDGTDPWGTNWHHQSPYDVGHNHDRVSPENSEVSSSRVQKFLHPLTSSILSRQQRQVRYRAHGSAE